MSQRDKENFQSHQIVCLEYENTCLYGEVIQVVEQREICWFRPWMLAISPCENSLLEWKSQEETIYNLHLTADLLWPLDLFRPALDIEVIPLLEKLDILSRDSEDSQQLSQQLNSFIHKLWQAHKAKFEVS